MGDGIRGLTVAQTANEEGEGPPQRRVLRDLKTYKFEKNTEAELFMHSSLAFAN
jgi:hypothetical protein